MVVLGGWVFLMSEVGEAAARQDKLRKKVRVLHLWRDDPLSAVLVSRHKWPGIR